MPATHQDPLRADLIQKWKELGELASNFRPAKLPMHCEGDDFRAIVKDLEQLVSKVDGLVSAYGDYVEANMSGTLEIDLFRDQLAGALEGNAFYEIESAAVMADEEMAEVA